MWLQTETNIAPRYQGYIGAALVLGGVDVTGPHLYSIHPHGSTDKLPYVTMGEWCSCGARAWGTLHIGASGGFSYIPSVCWELPGPQTTKIKLYL